MSIQSVIEMPYFKCGRSEKQHKFNLCAFVHVQDYPGRSKLWHIGVPPSGPMDCLAFRMAKALVGNAPDAAGLEVTLSGESLFPQTLPTKQLSTGFMSR